MTSAKGINIKKTIFLDKIEVSITEDKMFYIHIYSEVEVTLDRVKEIIKAMSDLKPGKKLPVLIEADSFSLPSKETREFLAKKDSSPDALIEAYVIKSTAQKIVGNFYLNFDKPQRPTRIFTDIDKALEWIEALKV